MRKGSHHSEESKAKMAASQKSSPLSVAHRVRLHSRPGIHAKASPAQLAGLEAGRKPEARAKAGATNSASQRTSPKAIAARAALLTSPEHLSNLGRNHHDPEVKKRQAATLAGNKENSERLAAMSRTPEISKRRVETRAGNPKWVESHRAHLDRMNRDPVMLAKMVSRKNPSPGEVALGRFMPEGFIATGTDSSRRILGRLPDYQCPEKRLIVEYDGHYSHRTEAGIIKDRNRDALLLTDGWKTLRVAPWEMKDPGALRSRLASFAAGETRG